MATNEKIITRTITTLSVNVLGFNAADEPEKKTFVIPMMDRAKIGSYLAKICGDYTPAKILDVTKIEELYGISESDFIKYGHKLEPRKNYNNKES